jgi:uncharacterized protein YjiS (DUF1127 family)
MKFDTADSLYRVHGIGSDAARGTSLAARVRQALKDAREAWADHRRARLDRDYLSRMPDRQLRDIGLHRIGGGKVLPIVHLDHRGL